MFSWALTFLCRKVSVFKEYLIDEQELVLIPSYYVIKQTSGCVRICLYVRERVLHYRYWPYMYQFDFKNYYVILIVLKVRNCSI